MAAPLRPSDPIRSNGMVPADWPVQAADHVVEAIGKVRDKTTKPAMIAARALVYGLMAVILGAVAIVVFIILLGRIWSNSVPGDPDIWVLYLLLSVLMIFGGLYCLRKANKPVPAHQ